MQQWIRGRLFWFVQYGGTVLGVWIVWTYSGGQLTVDTAQRGLNPTGAATTPVVEPIAPAGNPMSIPPPPVL